MCGYSSRTTSYAPLPINRSGQFRFVANSASRNVARIAFRFWFLTAASSSLLIVLDIVHIVPPASFRRSIIRLDIDLPLIVLWKMYLVSLIIVTLSKTPPHLHLFFRNAFGLSLLSRDERWRPSRQALKDGARPWDRQADLEQLLNEISWHVRCSGSVSALLLVPEVDVGFSQLVSEIYYSVILSFDSKTNLAYSTQNTVIIFYSSTYYAPSAESKLNSIEWWHKL